MVDRPAFVEVPLPSGGTITAVVSNRLGVAPTFLNEVPHVGLLLSVNQASATIAILTVEEAEENAQLLLAAARGIRLRNA